MIRLTIDRGACMGAQRCVYLAPRVFRLGEDGIAEIVDADALSEDEIVRVARECPNFAIHVVRDGVVLVGDPEESS